MVVLHHKAGVGKEEIGVRLDMNAPAVLEEATIAFHEIGGREAFRGLLHLWVGEGQPDFAHLAWGKESFDKFNVCAQEGNVLHAFAERCCGSVPHARAFDVDGNKVLLGKEAT